MKKTLSIIIPVYNEENYIKEIYSKVIGVKLHQINSLLMQKMQKILTHRV